MSCSAHAPKSAMPGEATIVTLSRPSLARTAMRTPSSTPGLSAGGTLAAQDRTILHVDPRKRCTSMPLAAAGTIPKSDSTE